MDTIMIVANTQEAEKAMMARDSLDAIIIRETPTPDLFPVFLRWDTHARIAKNLPQWRRAGKFKRPRVTFHCFLVKANSLQEILDALESNLQYTHAPVYSAP